MTTPLEAEILEEAVQRACQAAEITYRCDYPDCDRQCRHRIVAETAIRAFISDPHLGISYECRETLRAHLGEG